MNTRNKTFGFLVMLVLMTIFSGCTAGLSVTDGGVSPASEVIAPTVSSTTPASDATDVLIDSLITFTFDKTMDADSVTEGAFSLMIDGSEVDGTFAYDESTNTGTFTPTNYLENSNSLNTVSYTATISNSVKSSEDANMEADYEWSFDSILASLWFKTFSISIRTRGYSVVQKSSGNYALAGMYGGNENANMLFLEIDETGVVLDQNVIDPSGDDILTQIKATSDGGYISVGSSNNGTLNYDYWVIKFDSNNDIVWQKQYAGDPDDTDSGVSIDVTNDGGYVVGGLTTSFGAADQDVWMLKLDASGDIESQYRIHHTGYNEIIYKLKEISAGNYIIVGSRSSDAVPDDWEMMYVKLGSDLTADWGFHLGGTAGDDEIRSVDVIDSDNIVMVGNTETYAGGSGDVDLFVFRVDGSGNMQSFVVYGEDGKNETAIDVKATSDGGYILTGYQEDSVTAASNGVVMKFDSSGNIDWQRKIIIPDNYLAGYSVIEDDNGNYVIVGTLADSSLNYYAYLTIIDENGNIHDQCNCISDLNLEQQVISAPTVTASVVESDITAITPTETVIETQATTVSETTECSY